MYENRKLKRIFGHMKEEVTEGRRELSNKELHNLYSSLNFIRIIKLRRVRWAEHGDHTGEVRNVYMLI
jgi:hypothetical protein